MKRIAAILAVLLAAGAFTPMLAAGHAGNAVEETTITVSENGDARVEIALVYNMDNESQAERFTELNSNQTKQNELRDEYRNKLESRLSGNASISSFSTSTVTLHEDDDAGVIAFVARVDNAAEVQDDRIVMTTYGDFTTEMQHRIVAPDGYTVANTSPEPLTYLNENALFEANTNLEGLEVVIEPAGSSTNGDGNGLPVVPIAAGGVVAVVVIAGGLLYLRD